MVRSSNRRAPPLLVAPAAVAAAAPAAPGAFGEALELPVLDLVLVTAALVDGAEAEAELDAMPAWMDGEADTAADSMAVYSLALQIDLFLSASARQGRRNWSVEAAWRCGQAAHSLEATSERPRLPRYKNGRRRRQASKARTRHVF